LKNGHAGIRRQHRGCIHCTCDLIENIFNCIAIANNTATIKMQSIEENLARYRWDETAGLAS
jgi:hypothetical protein